MRNIYAKANNSSYSLGNAWGNYYDEIANTLVYRVNGDFAKVFDGNDKVIYMLTGGSLFNTINNVKISEVTHIGEVKSLKLKSTHSYLIKQNPDDSAPVAVTLDGGVIHDVVISGDTEATAGIACNITNGGAVYACKVAGTITSKQATVAGVAKTINNGNIGTSEGYIVLTCTLKSKDTSTDNSAAGVVYEISGIARQNDQDEEKYGIVAYVTTVDSGDLGQNINSSVDIECNGAVGGVACQVRGGQITNIGLVDKAYTVTLLNSCNPTTVGGIVNNLIDDTKTATDNSSVTYSVDNVTVNVNAATSGRDTLVFGGLVCSGNAGSVNDCQVAINSSQYLRTSYFGGLYGKQTEDGTKINFTSNIVHMATGEDSALSVTGTANSVGGLFSAWNGYGGEVTNNTVVGTLVNNAIDPSSATGGLVGKLTKIETAGNISGNSLGSDNTPGIIKGVYNVGGFVGYYDTTWMASDGEQSRTSQIFSNSTTETSAVHGWSMVGGVVGFMTTKAYSQGTKELTINSNSIHTTGLTVGSNSAQELTSGHKSYFGGMFGFIENMGSSTVYLNELENNNMVVTENTRYVGGIVGKLGYNDFVLGADNSNDDTILPDIPVPTNIDNPVDINVVISSCKNKNQVAGQEFVGGITGLIATKSNKVSIVSSSNLGPVSGLLSVGGVVGFVYAPADTTDNTTYIKLVSLSNEGEVGAAGSSNSLVTRKYLGGVIGVLYTTARTIVTNDATEDSTTHEILDGSCNFSDFSSGSQGTVSGTGIDYVGGIFGRIVSTSGSIKGFENVTVNGSVVGNKYVGGIIGAYQIDPNFAKDKDSSEAVEFKISNCHVSSSANEMKGTAYVGGLFGYLSLTLTDANSDVTIKSAYEKNITASLTNLTNANTIRVMGDSGEYFGGIIGYLDASNMVTTIGEGGTIIENKGYILTDSDKPNGGYIGGIFGYAKLSSYNGATGANLNAYGGDVLSTVYNLSNTKAIGVLSSALNQSPDFNRRYVGGIFGCVEYTGDSADPDATYVVSTGIRKLENTAKVEGYQYVGGLFGTVKNVALHGWERIRGTNDTTWENMSLQNSGAVYGLDYVGGIIGDTQNNILGYGDFHNANHNQNISVEINAGNFVYKVNNDIETSGIINTGNVYGAGHVGGIAGRVGSDTKPAVINDVSYDGNVYRVSKTGTSIKECAGGIVGEYVESEDSRNQFNLLSNIPRLRMTSSANIDVLSENDGARLWENVGGLIGKYDSRLEDNNTISPVGNNVKYIGSTKQAKIAGRKNVGALFGLFTYSKDTVFNFNNDTLFDGNTSNDIVNINAQVIGSRNVGGLIGNISNDNYAVTIHKVRLNVTMRAFKPSGTESTNIGGLVGNLDVPTASFNTIHTKGNNLTATDSDCVGGLVGYACVTNKINVTSCMLGDNSQSTPKIEGHDKVGGYFGYEVARNNVAGITFDVNNNGDIDIGSNISYYKIEANDYVGGIAGCVEDAIGITANKSLTVQGGPIVGHDFVGGIAGDVIRLTGDNNSNIQVINTSVKGSGNYVGGIAGRLQGSIINCSVSGGSVETTSTGDEPIVGGLVGQLDGYTSIVKPLDNCSISGTEVRSTVATQNKGYLVGYLDVTDFAANATCMLDATYPSNFADDTLVGTILTKVSAVGMLDNTYNTTKFEIFTTKYQSDCNIKIGKGEVTDKKLLCARVLADNESNIFGDGLKLTTDISDLKVMFINNDPVTGHYTTKGYEINQTCDFNVKVTIETNDLGTIDKEYIMGHIVGRNAVAMKEISFTVDSEYQGSSLYSYTYRKDISMTSDVEKVLVGSGSAAFNEYYTFFDLYYYEGGVQIQCSSPKEAEGKYLYVLCNIYYSVSALTFDIESYFQPRYDTYKEDIDVILNTWFGENNTNLKRMANGSEQELINYLGETPCETRVFDMSNITNYSE